MLEQELQLERDLFLFLNGTHSLFLDNVMYIYTQMITWLPWILCFLFVFIYKKNWKEIVLVILAVALVFLLCDQLSSLVKSHFHRFRPTHHPDFRDVVHTVFNYRGGRYGFFSGHATNTFGIATFVSLLFRNKILSITMFLFALLTIYSRIYLGVHFISDTVVGALVGSLIGYLIYRLYRFSRCKWLKVEKTGTELLFSTWKSNFLCGVFIVHLTILLLFSSQLIKVLF